MAGHVDIQCVLREGPSAVTTALDDLETLALVGQDGSALRAEGVRDAAKLLSLIEMWARTGREGAIGLEFTPVAGDEYEGKLLVASYFRSKPRSDGVRVYHFFYVESIDSSEERRIVWLVTLYAATEEKTPARVIAEAWTWAKNALRCVEAETSSRTNSRRLENHE